MKFIPDKVSILGLVLVVSLSLAACEKLKVEPVAVRGEAIVGHWYAQQSSQENEFLVLRHVHLQVREDGYARYYSLFCETNQQSLVTNSRSLELDYTPIKRLNQTKMLLQRYPLTPQFELTIGHWPDAEDDRFEVDQVQLERVNESEVPEFQAWNCDSSPSA